MPVRRIAALLGLPAALSLLVACGPGGSARVDTAKIVDAIQADEVRTNVDYTSGDPAKVAAHFAPDATLMVPGAPPIVGTAAIKTTIKTMMDDPAFAFTFSSDRVVAAASGDVAVSRGRYSLTQTDPGAHAAKTSTGAYVTLWRRQPGGAWKAAWDIASPGPPATPGAAATK